MKSHESKGKGANPANKMAKPAPGGKPAPTHSKVGHKKGTAPGGHPMDKYK